MVNVKKHTLIPINAKHFIGQDDTGYVEYSSLTEHKCYIEEGVKTVLDEFGEEVTSDTTLYFDGEVPVERKDLIIVDGIDRRIKAMDKIRTKKGKLVLKVVYL